MKESKHRFGWTPASRLGSSLLACAVAAAMVGCTPGGREGTLGHGRYLVERVAMCIDCHTPRGPDGSFDQARWLQGAPIAFAPTVPMPAWADDAPPIAGLPGYTDTEAIRLLTTGISRTGGPLRPPMPDYRMTEEDAAAAVAYLRELGRR